MRRVVFLAGGLWLGLAGCLEIERKAYSFDMANKTGEVRFINIVSDSADNAGGDFTELMTKFIQGTQIDEDNPGWNITSKEVFEENGQLHGLVKFSFNSPKDVGVYKHDKKSPYFYCADHDASESMLSTNGQRIEESIKGCAVWDRKATALDVTVKASDIDGSEVSLLAEYKKYKESGKLPEAAAGGMAGLEGGLEGLTSAMEGIAGSLSGAMPGTTTHGSAVVDGPVDAGAIDAVLAPISSLLGLCYATALATTPGISGDTTIVWDLAADGTASGFSVRDSSLGQGDVEQCLIRQLQGQSYPSAAKKSSVRLPFHFTP